MIKGAKEVLIQVTGLNPDEAYAHFVLGAICVKLNDIYAAL